jgi:hypothetical protein
MAFVGLETGSLQQMARKHALQAARAAGREHKSSPSPGATAQDRKRQADFLAQPTQPCSVNLTLATAPYRSA